MELIAGYKPSDVGALPEDWDVLPLGKLVRSVEYGSAAKSDVKGAVPVLRMGNLQGGKIDWSDLVYTDDIDEINKYRLQSGDVLFNRTNTIDLVGKTSIYEGDCPAIFAGYLIRINVVPELLDSRFLNYVLNTEFSRKYSAKVLSVAVGQANINGQKLKTYPIPLPPTTTEQESIAQALTDVDALLAGLDQMITKKRDLKQAAMQQLLTGKTRLPGCSGTWEAKRLGEVAEIVMGQSPSSSNYNSIGNGLPLIQGNADIENRWAIKRTYTTQITKRGKAGDVLMSVRAPVGEVSRTMFDVCLGRGVCAIRYSNEFLYHTLVFMEPNWVRHSKGSTFDSVNSDDVKNVEIRFPVEETEQIAIASILSDMDVELAELEARRDKTRSIKQAMMQELLTGKTRLV